MSRRLPRHHYLYVLACQDTEELYLPTPIKKYSKIELGYVRILTNEFIRETIWLCWFRSVSAECSLVWTSSQNFGSSFAGLRLLLRTIYYDQNTHFIDRKKAMQSQKCDFAIMYHTSPHPWLPMALHIVILSRISLWNNAAIREICSRSPNSSTLTRIKFMDCRDKWTVQILANLKSVGSGWQN